MKVIVAPIVFVFVVTVVALTGWCGNGLLPRRDREESNALDITVKTCDDEIEDDMEDTFVIASSDNTDSKTGSSV